MAQHTAKQTQSRKSKRNEGTAEPPREVVVLGLDTASHVIGYGLMKWTGETPLLLDYGIMTLMPRQSHDQRLYHLAQLINTLCDEASVRVTRFAIEQTHFRKNFQVAITLAKFVGVAQMVAWQRTGLPAHLITASEIRRLIHSKDKDDTKRIVEDKFGIDLSEQVLDVSDAIAVAWTSLTRERLAEEGG